MNEEEKTQEVQTPEKSQATETPKEAKQEEVNAVVRAEKAAEAMKVQNDRFEELTKRNEKAMAVNIVSGETNAGAEKPKPKEETDEEFTERFESGQVDLLA